MKDEGSLHFGWVIVGTSFVTLALAYAVWYSFSVFFVALLKEFGWSRSTTAGAFSLFIILHSLVGPFVGNMVDRLGPKRMIILGSLLLGSGLALCSLMQTWWQFYLFFGMVAAVGVGTIGWVPNITIIQQWFKEKRGLPVGIVSSGIGIGILVCVPGIQYLIAGFGWRMTYRIMSIVIPAVTLSMAIFLLRRSPQPSRVCHVPKGTSSQPLRDPLIIDEMWASRSWTVRRAVSTRQFWLLAFSLLTGNIMTHSILTHHVAFFVDQGARTQFASYIVGMVGIVSMAGKILWAALSDRIGREKTYTIGMVFAACGMMVLILFQLFRAPGLSYLYAFFFGMGYAATASLPPLLTADLFEGKAYGGIFGSLMMLVGLGGAVGAWLAGFVFDQTGSYLPLFIIIIGAILPLTCISIWKAAPRKIRTVPGKRSEIRSPVLS